LPGEARGASRQSSVPRPVAPQDRGRPTAPKVLRALRFADKTAAGRHADERPRAMTPPRGRDSLEGVGGAVFSNHLAISQGNPSGAGQPMQRAGTRWRRARFEILTPQRVNAGPQPGLGQGRRPAECRRRQDVAQGSHLDAACHRPGLPDGRTRADDSRGPGYVENATLRPEGEGPPLSGGTALRVHHRAKKTGAVRPSRPIPIEEFPDECRCCWCTSIHAHTCSRTEGVIDGNHSYPTAAEVRRGGSFPRRVYEGRSGAFGLLMPRPVTSDQMQKQVRFRPTTTPGSRIARGTVFFGAGVQDLLLKVDAPSKPRKLSAANNKNPVTRP